MTLRTHLVSTALLASMVADPALAATGASSASVAVKLAAQSGASVGRATSVSCVATDLAGIKDVTFDATGPDGVKVAIPVTDKIDLGRGAVQAEGAWVPSKAGPTSLRCVALGLSSVTANGAATVQVVVGSQLSPIVDGLDAAKPVVLVGKEVELRASALDPEGGPLRFAWTATKGTIVGKGASATWLAPATEGTYTVQVAVTDDTGLITKRSVAVEASTVVFQDTAPASLRGPRRIAAGADGTFWIVDAEKKLSKLTKRGDFMGTALSGVRSVAVGNGVVYAGTDAGELVKVDPVVGRIVGRIALGYSPGPSGLAYDSVRDELWLALNSGVVEARRMDGSLVRQITSSSAGALLGLVDVAVDSSAGIVWVAQDRNRVGGMIFGYRVTDGVQVRVIGLDGAGPARTTGAIAVGAGGQVYVSDAFSGKVEVVGPTGATVRKIGRPGRNSGELARPAGMAFMANGDLLVANMDAGRLDRFGNETPAPACTGDMDCDGISDADEAAAGLDQSQASDALADLDGDGLNNTEELLRGTKVAVADSDGDGFPDGREVSDGFDPLNGRDHVATLTASGSAHGGPGRIGLTGSVGGLPGDVACESAWRQLAGPSVALSNPASLAPSFVARKAGAYRFALDATCAGVAALGAVAEVVVDNVAPVVDAGRVVVVAPGARLKLSAAASSDANGDAPTFAWEQVAGAPVSGAVAGKSLSALFGQAGTYSFAVTATDAGGASGAAEAQVVVVGNTPVPVASVVSPVLAAATQVVTLDASGSFAASDAVFEWRQVAGAAVELTGQGTPTASFQAPGQGRYAFQVAVQQGRVRSPPALVEVFVSPVGATLPVAVAAAPAVALVNGGATLDGSASTGSGALKYAWRQVAGPAAGLRNADAAVADSYFFAPGSYVFELSVSDGMTESVPARVRVEARADGRPIPVARASAPEVAAVGELVTLDGSASVGATTFQWTQVSGPWVAVQGGSRAAFVAAAPGRYGFELEVQDGQARSAPVRVEVEVTQNGTEN